MQRVDLYPAVLPSKWWSGSIGKSAIMATIIVALMVLGPWGIGSGDFNRQMQIQVNHNADYYQTLQTSVKPYNQVGRELDRQLADEHFIGTALIIRDNRIIIQAGYGKADYQKNKPNTVDSLYHIASLEKAMTAALIVQQIDAGKLDYDTKLSRFYPQVVNASKITVRDLLTMTSGLRQDKQPTSFESEIDNIDYSAHHVEKIGEPGDGHGWSYQPVNYRFLAGILMKLSRHNFSTIFNQVFNNTYRLNVLNYQDFGSSHKLSTGYQENLDEPVGVKKIEYQRETGTGNVAMTTGMLYRFYRLIFDQKLVKHSQEMFQTVPPASYTSGVYQANGYKTAHGIFNGYEPSVVISQDGRDAVILLSNQYYKGHSFEDLSHRLFNQISSISNSR